MLIRITNSRDEVKFFLMKTLKSCHGSVFLSFYDDTDYPASAFFWRDERKRREKLTIA